MYMKRILNYDIISSLAHNETNASKELDIKLTNCRTYLFAHVFYGTRPKCRKNFKYFLFR